MESSLPHDVVEHILERLAAKSLLRFKSVLKKWKSTIETRYFQERQLIHRRDLDDLLVYITGDLDVLSGPNIQLLAPVTLTPVRIFWSTYTNAMYVSQTTCDGLVCVYHPYGLNIVVNPTTRWSRSFPSSSFQQLIRHIKISKVLSLGYEYSVLGFGKDNFNGTDTYKPVLLYNSSELGLDNATTCEVFDFTTNAWRFVIPASPHRIIPYQEPLYLDGSLHWFTEGEETNVLSFDLHTETFQVISKAPFGDDRVVYPPNMAMYCLDNRLCVSEQMLSEQVIWSFDSGNKTWDKLYFIALTITSSWFWRHGFAFSALALPVKNKLLLYNRGYKESKQRLVLYDTETKSYELVFTADSIGLPLFYVQNLISIP